MPVECRCQEEASEQPPCCSPHVFTSVLLGLLACVLMTGGVFLAFHKWDPMWLLVSGIGVLLIVVGTVLHCCHALAERRTARRSSAAPGKGCCPRALSADHPHPLMANGSLTEQLLPLSNARSVSQLSLNMLPGYFPPVVTAYGIEQHSSVVQNINRLVQQQQQQPPQTNGSCSPGVSSNAGKSFIVLSLPNDATAANIQNLVAAVYQLEGSNAEPTAETSNATSPITIIKPNPVPSVLKNAEVQTCNAWPAVVSATASAGVASTSTENSALQTQASTESRQSHSVSTSTGGTQTEDNSIPNPPLVNLMDCSEDVGTFGDVTPEGASDTLNPNTSALNSDSAATSTSERSNDLSSASPAPTDSTHAESTSVAVELPDRPLVPCPSEPAPTSTSILVDVGDVPSSSDVLVALSENSGAGDSANQRPVLEDLMDAVVIEQVDVAASNSDSSTLIPSDGGSVQSPPDANLVGATAGPSLTRSGSSSSVNDSDDIDDAELMDRSSPPPSYDDVTLEGEPVGAFGLAYGTI